MSKAAKKTPDAPPEPSAPAPSSPRRRIVKAEKATTDEAIELALAAAGTAVESAQEIQRLRDEVQSLLSGARRNNMILFWTAAMILLIAGAGLFGSLVYFRRAWQDYDIVAKANREALSTFAGEVNALVEASRLVDERLKSAQHAVEGAQAAHEHTSKALGALTAAQHDMAARALTPNAFDKNFAAVQKSLDELTGATRAMATRMAELQNKPARAQPASAPTPRARAPEPPRPARRAGAEPLIQFP